MYTEKKINEYVEAGVNGYILKDCKIDDFLSAIVAVASGKEVIPCFREEILITDTHKPNINELKEMGKKKPVKMTKRERQVLGMIANGTASKEISRQLHLSAFKLKNHIHDIFEKVAMHSRGQTDS